MKMPTNRPPIHPGEILLDEFMKPYGMTQTEIAKRIGVSRKHISEIVNGRKGISTDIALPVQAVWNVSGTVVERSISLGCVACYTWRKRLHVGSN